MSTKLPGLGVPMQSEGINNKTQEYWTVIGGRKIYAKSLEQLYRTVAYGWSVQGERCKCIYCGREWYVMSEPCVCLADKGDMGKRVRAMQRLHEIESKKANG